MTLEIADEEDRLSTRAYSSYSADLALSVKDTFVDIADTPGTRRMDMV